MSSLLRFQQEQAKKEQEAQKFSIPEKSSLFYQFADTIFLILLSLWLLISYYLLNSFSIETIYYEIISILIVSVLSFIWITNKLKINIKTNFIKEINSNKKYYFISILLSSLNFFFVSNFILFPIINDPILKENLLNSYLIISLLFLFALLMDLYLLSSSKDLDKLYLNNFLKNKMNTMDPNKDNISKNFLALLGIFILFPLILLFIYFQRIDYSIFVLLSSLTIIFIGYWIGYGLYRSYRWVQGYDSTINMSLIQQFDLKILLSLLSSIISSLLVFFSVVLFFFIYFGILALDYSISVILFIILFYVYSSQILKIANIKINNNKKYSFHLNISIFSLIPLVTPIIIIMFSETSNINNVIELTDVFGMIKLLFLILFVISILITYFTYRQQLNHSMWTDRYEAGQLLSEINLALKKPKIIHLNLLAKLGLAQKDPMIIMKLLTIYQNLLSNKNLTPELLDTMHTFLLYEIEYANEWNVHAIAFDLVNQLLEYENKFYKDYYNIAKKISNHNNELVRQVNLNLLGHLLHIDRTLADEIFPIAIEVYNNSSDELKKNNIEPLKYYANNFPEYREKLFTFVIERIEKEYFGVSTELMGIIDVIAESDKTYFDRVMKLCEKILTEPDSNAGLGAVRILVNNFPNNPKEGIRILKIMIEYLKIGLPEVKHHVIYNLGTIIKRIPALTAILEDIDFAIYDEDPNVRSALIQTISELFPLGNLPEEVLSTYLQNGINDYDYVVRLVTIQQINNLVETTPYILKQLPVYLEKSLKDSNSDVFEEAYSIFQKNYVYLQNNFTKWVKETGLDIDKIR